ncbi:MAG: HlyD family efflux transporter periplasmic adaptor subunit [Planctomycetes bacterium]|nr:HlyD family efflux transporter periplasmic adaptor subunit [Planctomycetota bacterium]
MTLYHPPRSGGLFKLRIPVREFPPMLLPSSHRPIPLVRRSDLQVCAVPLPEHSPLRQTDLVVIKDPLALVYHQLPLLQYRVLETLDGRRSLTEILSLVQSAGLASSITAAEVFRLIVDLAGKRLIWSQRPGTAESLLRQADQDGWRRFWAAVRNPLFIRLPGLNPGQTLSIAANYVGWVYSTSVVMAVVAGILGSWFFLLLHLETFLRELPNISALLTGNGLWTLWIVVGLLKVVHELSHGLACERFGAHCQSIGLAFLFFSPCMYCDVTDAWMLERKSQRIAVSLAGVYVELFISAIGFWCWRLSGPGVFHQISLQVFLAGSIATLLFNANPLLRFDGYYVLADLVEIPNLYQRSRQAIQRVAARTLMGFRTPDDSTGSRESPSILLTYGIASTAYQIPLMIGIGVFLYQMLEPLGLSILVWICLAALATRIAQRTVTWSVRMFRKQKSPVPVLIRSTFSAILLSAILVGLWFCPLGNAMTAPVVIAPRSTQPMYVETPGTVRQVCVRAGDLVEPGTVLLELEDLELDRRLISLEGLRASHELDFRLAQSIGDPDLMILARTAIEATTNQIELAQADKDRLQVQSRIRGKVISTKERPSETADANESTGEPPAELLSAQSIGRYLPRRSCLCEIAPETAWQASLWIDQRSRSYLSPGQPIAVRLDAFAGHVVHGKVLTVSTANELEIPSTIATRFGGSLATRPTAAGEVPLEPVYCATIELQEVELPVQAGMRGTGRFTCPAMTVGSWLMDEFHRVFVVR